MATTQAGIHHTTGITGDAQANVDFYAGLLGLRLVKRTVSHNDKSALHLFYGDGEGTPGTLLSFFAWPDTARGRRGAGQATEIGLAVPQENIGDWVQRLLSKGVTFSGPTPSDRNQHAYFRGPRRLACRDCGRTKCACRGTVGRLDRSCCDADTRRPPRHLLDRAR